MMDDDDDDGRPTCLHYERNVRNIVSLLSVICDFPQGRPYPNNNNSSNNTTTTTTNNNNIFISILTMRL